MADDTINNPNARALHLVREEDDGDKDVPRRGDASKPVILVNPLIKATNYDEAIENLTRTIETKVVGLDARVLEGTGRNRQLKHYKSFRQFMESAPVKARLREHTKLDQLKTVTERLREGHDEFLTGDYPDERTGSDARKLFPTTDTVLPTLNSPFSKQQTLHDYMTAHVRCWEAATRNPLGKRIVNIVPQFVLGRGLTCDVPEPAHQAAWDDFSERHDLPLRLKVWLRELMIYGEQFNRHWKRGGKLVQRQVDPCTIWDVVTDVEDLENVQYYYQQYLASSPIIVPGSKQPPSTLIIRHIPAADVDHFTLNKSSSEKRGRSELYAIIGWLLRLKEFMNDRVILNKLRAMFALDVSVAGGRAEVDAANAQFAQPPGPGAVLVHNAAVTVDYKNASTDAADAKTDAEMLLKIIAIGAGVSEQFLGVSSASTRAGALLQTEPDVKNFETYQQVMERMLQKTYKRLVDAEGLGKTKATFEVSFPSLAAEDRTVKLKDLAISQAQQWISAERAGTMAAREFGITRYDWEQERLTIKKELAGDPLVMQGFQAVPAVMPEDPMMAGGSPAGAGAPNATNDDGRKVATTAGQMGYSAKGKSGRSLANTSATLARGEFTRGGERASVRGRKSAGAPLRASAVWSSDARAASLETRRRNKLARLMLEAESLPADSARRRKLDTEIVTVRTLLEGARGDQPAE